MSEQAQKLPAELRFEQELRALAEADPYPKPDGWKLSPRAVRTFIVGSNGSDLKRGQRKGPETTRKFHGDDALVDRAIVTLMSNRALLLLGEPGTAKSMLSELFAAAISGTSHLTVQGSAGTTEDQIKYAWNYALLLAKGPVPEALVPAPLHQGLTKGCLVRFEEITRCPPEVQDTLISVLSDKVLHVPELSEGGVIRAAAGFNLIATANTRDRGVHEMSAALKRRFNFETVRPIRNPDFERELVLQEAGRLLEASGVESKLTEDVIEVLVTTFSELRQGKTVEGTVLERPEAAPMSTAEAVSVALSAGLEAAHFGSGKITAAHVGRQLVGTVLKDSEEDRKRVRHYFDVVVKTRAKQSSSWKALWSTRDVLDG